MFKSFKCGESRKCGEPGVFCVCRCACGIGICVAFVLVFGYVVMLLWNWLVPSLFASVGRLDFLQGVGLLVLARILFGGGHRRGHHHYGYGKGWYGHYSSCGTDKSDSCCDTGDWRQFESWWEAEGKEQFKKYSDKKRQETPPAL